jgi:formylglycine-generating enzyme required for sulfatase activity
MRVILVAVLCFFASIAGCVDSHEVCEPDCQGRECGLDPVCQLNCGSCRDGQVCSAEGRCVAQEDGGDADATDGGDPRGDDGPAPADDGGTTPDEGDGGGDAADETPDPCLNPALDCSVPQPETAVSQGPDEDGDDWGACCECDDQDETVHPGVRELDHPSDGKDNDCNGLVDEPGGRMVKVPYNNVWIDAYETVVSESADCSGPFRGQADDDYPADWPVEGDHDATLYACSLPGVIPSGHLSWYRSRWACEAQGKRLCTVFEWGYACSDGGLHIYPYGGDFLDDVCNVGVPETEGTTEVAPTRSFGECVSVPGVWDMSGNLGEWLSNWINLPGDCEACALATGMYYPCELCTHGQDCHLCSEDTADPMWSIEHSSGCQPALVEPAANEVFPRSMAKAYLGTRCCLDGP